MSAAVSFFTEHLCACCWQVCYGTRLLRNSCVEFINYLSLCSCYVSAVLVGHTGLLAGLLDSEPINDAGFCEHEDRVNNGMRQSMCHVCCSLHAVRRFVHLASPVPSRASLETRSLPISYIHLLICVATDTPCCMICICADPRTNVLMCIPGLWSYIQWHYWNNGPFQYWQVVYALVCASMYMAGIGRTLTRAHPSRHMIDLR